MIEGMKRTILIPILLSTFLLVGCESELDRCIEANGGNVDFDLALYREKIGVEMFFEEETLGYAYADLNSIELEFYLCESNIYNGHSKEFEYERLDWQYLIEKTERDAINKYCLSELESRKRYSADSWSLFGLW